MARSLKTFTCKQCNKQFQTRNWKSNLTPQFCSVKCRSLSKIKHKEQNCIFCGKEFKPKKEGMFFCSMECFNEYKKSKQIAVVCKNCGKVFFVRPSEVENRNVHFCNNDCKFEFQKAKTIEKECLTCGKTFSSFVRENRLYCSNMCNLTSKERKNNLSKKYTGVPLVERGFSQEQVDSFVKNVSLKNVEKQIGKTYKEIYGEVRANEISQKLSELKSGVSLYNLIMEKHNVSYEEARELMPAYGRNGEKHPMFGKHHSVESKQKMMESFNNKYDGKLGRFAYGFFNEIRWHGSWELKYLIDCYENNIEVKRWEGEPILYYFEGKPHHYFPDFIVGDKIVEIKGLRDGTEKVKTKTEAAQKIYGDRYVYINNIDQPYPAKVFYSLTKEKYFDILEIIYNPHKEKSIGN